MAVQNLAQFHAVEMEESGELPFAQQSLSVDFRCQQVQPQGRWAVGVGFVEIGRG